MFRILGLFRTSLRPIPSRTHACLIVANRQQYAESEVSLADLDAAPGERLVRIPLDEVQAGSTRPS